MPTNQTLSISDVTRSPVACRPDLGDDAAGKIALEEGKRLARHMQIGLPARHVVETRRDDLLVDQGDQEGNDEADDADQRQHAEKLAAMGVKKRAPAGPGLYRSENIDEPPHEPEERCLDRRRNAAKHQHGDERPSGLADIEPYESQRIARRLDITAGAERIYPGFEQAEDRSEQHHRDIGPFRIAAKRIQARRNLIFS
jgi:hypothetical protein